MKLAHLEMVGFKSFMNKTTIEFEDGITAVVGPNGCGKSNIVDAIFWVMGDQSPKHLRGNEMEDIIFAGSEGHPQAGMAEVHLTLSTEDGGLPAQYSQFSEITVTRRLYRSGESEYLINKTPCRLRDVLELFMDSGVGAKSYSVIEQGHIGKIVSQKPEERRTFIEEAAGIVKFKSRKHEAQLKIEATEQNLLRLNDIISEIKRQIDSLERQAKKAERYKQIKEEIREIELTTISHQYVQESRELEKIETLRKEEELKRETFLTETQKKENESERLKLKLTEMEKGYENLQQLLYQHQQKIYQLESTRELRKKEIEHWLTLQKKDEEAIQTIKAKREQIEKSLRNVVQALEEAIRQESQVKEGTGRYEKEIESEVQKSLHLRSKIDQDKEELVSIVTELTKASHRLLHLDEKKREAESRIEELSEEEKDLEAELKKFGKAKDEVEAVISKVHGDQREIQNQKAATELELKGLKENYTRLLQKKEDAKEGLQLVSSRIQSLAELKGELEEEMAGIGCFSDEERMNFHILGTLSDVLEVDVQYEKALETVLENRLRAMLVEKPHDALKIIDHLKAKESGVSWFLPMEDASFLSSASAAKPLTDSMTDSNYESLLEKVRVSKEHQPLISALLKDTYLVSDFKKALDFWYQTPGVYTFVTKEGESIGVSGFLFGGKGKGSHKGILAQKREAKELLAERTRLEKLYAELSLELEASAVRIDVLSSQIESFQQKFHETEMLRTSHERDVLKNEENLERLKEEKEALADEKNDELLLKNQLSEEAAKEETKKQSLEEKKKAKGAEASVAESTCQKVAVAIETKKKAFTELQVSQASLKEKKEALERQKEHLDLNLKTILSEIDEKRQAIQLSLERQKTVSTEIQEDEELLQTLIKEHETQKEELSALKNSFDQKNLETKTLEEDLRKLRGELHKIEMSFHDQELKFSQSQMTLKHLCDQVREKYLLELNLVCDRYQQKQLGEEDQKHLAALKEKAGHMGEVNLTAIQEFEELKTRYETLETQRQDLLHSMESLKKTIEKINRISRERFEETYARVNENFKKVFPILFGGGRAELILTDPDNLLETGVDITAKPPGKKHQNINLLSGGEKALTAVSLIFAAFLMRPSPFCLLDEVDAPLDDVNVGRFNEMVRQMTKHSQFIVITHNKKTMEMADTLYGVTMETAGVSMMVSVKFDRAVKMAESRVSAPIQRV
jgi:chromosome segregation protein